MSYSHRLLPILIGMVCLALLAMMSPYGHGIVPALALPLAVAAWWLARRSQVELTRLTDDVRQTEGTLNALTDAVMQLDDQGRLGYLNHAAAAMLGHPVEAPATGAANDWMLIDRDTRAPLLATLLAQSGKEGLVRIPAGTRLINRPGIELEVDGLCQPLGDHQGRVTRYLLHLRDITEENEWRRQQPDLWDRDPVSSLPGRHFMENRLNRALQNRRASDLPMAYIRIDLIGIRTVYDQAGQAAGDALIRYLSARLRTHIRDTDLIARMTDTSFSVLLNACPVEISQRIGHDIRSALMQFPFEWEHRIHSISARFGQVNMPPFEGCLDDLMAAAEPRP